MADRPGTPCSLSDLQARVACEEVLLSFTRLIDSGAATEAIELFAEDASLEVRGERFEGRQSILGFLSRRQADTGRSTRHLTSNFEFTMRSACEADGAAQLLIGHSHDGRLVLEAISDCRVTFVRSAEGVWLMRMRQHRRFATATARPD